MSAGHAAGSKWQCIHCMMEIPHLSLEVKFNVCPFCQKDVREKLPYCEICGMRYLSMDQRACRCLTTETLSTANTPIEETVPSHSTGQSGDSVCKIEQAAVIESHDKKPEFLPCSMPGPSENQMGVPGGAYSRPVASIYPTPPNIEDMESDFGSCRISQETGGQEGQDRGLSRKRLHEDCQQSNGQKKRSISATPQQVQDHSVSVQSPPRRPPPPPPSSPPPLPPPQPPEPAPDNAGVSNASSVDDRNPNKVDPSISGPEKLSRDKLRSDLVRNKNEITPPLTDSKSGNQPGGNNSRDEDGKKEQVHTYIITSIHTRNIHM